MSDRHDLQVQARENVIAFLAGGDMPTISKNAFEAELESDRWQAFMDLKSTRDELSRKMSEASNDLGQAEPYLRGEAARFNRLGILQGTGSDIDRLCGMFELQVGYAVGAEYRVLRAADLLNKKDPAKLPIPFGLSADELQITDGVDDNLQQELTWLANEVLSDDQAERIMRAAVLLKNVNAGTFAECLEQAIIWERG